MTHLILAYQEPRGGESLGIVLSVAALFALGVFLFAVRRGER